VAARANMEIFFIPAAGIARKIPEPNKE
jgi:hypothetical protein